MKMVLCVVAMAAFCLTAGTADADEVFRHKWIRGHRVLDLAINPQNGNAVSAGEGGMYSYVGEQSSRITPPAGTITVLKAIYSPDGQFFYSVATVDEANIAQRKCVLIKQKTGSGTELFRIPLDHQIAHSLVLSRNGKRLIIGSQGGSGRHGVICVYNASDGSLEFELQPDDERTWSPRDIDISPDGKSLVVGTFRSVELWDLESRKRKWINEEHKGWLKSVCYSPNGRFTVSFSEDYPEEERAILFLDAESGEQCQIYMADRPIVDVAISPDSSLLAISTDKIDSHLILWSIESEQRIAIVTDKRIREAPTHLRFSSDGKTLWGNLDGVCRWNIGPYSDSDRAAQMLAEKDSDYRELLQFISTTKDDRELVIGSFSGFDDEHYRLLQGHTKLEEITISGSGAGDYRRVRAGTGFARLKGLPNLRAITLSNMRFRNFEGLGELTQLKTLKITDESESDDWEGLSRLKALEELDLTGARIDNGVLSQIAELQNLRVLHLSHYRDKQDSVSLSQSALLKLAKLPELEKLTLSGSGITGSNLPSLSRFPQLKELDMRNSGVGWGCATQVEVATTLESIKVTYLDDYDLKTISRLPNLKTLEFGGPVVTYIGLNYLRRAPSLQNLSITNLKLPGMSTIRSPDQL